MTDNDGESSGLVEETEEAEDLARNERDGEDDIEEASEDDHAVHEWDLFVDSHIIELEERSGDGAAGFFGVGLEAGEEILDRRAELVDVDLFEFTFHPIGAFARDQAGEKQKTKNNQHGLKFIWWLKM